MELEKKLETIQGCLKKTNSKEEFEACIAPMTIEDTREALSELNDILKKD